MNALRCLVVEDSPDIAEMLELFFHLRGCRVERAETASGALACYWRAVAEGDAYGLLMLDFMLPGAEGMDGLAVARRIRGAEREAGWDATYICGYTGHENALIAPGAVERAGLDRFIVKAGSDDEMLALEEVLLEALAKRAGSGTNPAGGLAEIV